MDGFQDDLSLRGWVDASSFGSASSTVRVTWHERDDLLIGEGVATQARPDLVEAGLTALDCGFSVDLSFGQGESLLDLLDVPVTLRLVESKSGELIGGAPWLLSDAVKTTLLPGFVSAQIANRQDSSLQAYLAASTSSTFLSAIRYRLLEHSILSCFAGNWNDLPCGLWSTPMPAMACSTMACHRNRLDGSSWSSWHYVICCRRLTMISFTRLMTVSARTIVLNWMCTHLLSNFANGVSWGCNRVKIASGKRHCVPFSMS